MIESIFNSRAVIHVTLNNITIYREGETDIIDIMLAVIMLNEKGIF